MEKGLLSGVLPAVFSFSDVAKRKIADLFSNPVEYTQQLAGKVGDDVRDLRRLEKQAFADPKNPLQITDQEAFGKLADIYMTSLMNFAPMGMNVYHGSPHIFNKFDSSKIGTGEGAQAYGHGLYLAEAPEVAKQYQKQLSADGFLVGGKPWDPSTLRHLNIKSIVRKGNLDEAINKAKEIASSGSPVANLAADDLATLLGIKAKGGLGNNAGALYKVDLPDEQIAKMLDWDKPLSQQSKEVQQQLNVMLEKVKALPDSSLARGERQYLENPSSLKGSDIYNMFRRYFGGENVSGADASTMLQQQGIPGIRYLDQGSRGAGQGSSNFVVFPGNEGFLKILERNGKSLLD